MTEELVLYPNPIFPVKTSEYYLKAGSFPHDIHFHKEVELVRIEQGKILCQIGNDLFELSKGQVLILNRFCVHRFSSDGNDSVLTYFQFDMSEYLNDILPANQKHLYAFINTEGEKSYALFNTGDFPDGLLDNCFSILKCKENYYEIKAKGFLYLLTAFLCERGFVGNISCLKNNRALNVLLSVSSYVEENLTEKITLDGLCSELYLNKSNFCKLFRQATGRTFTDYVNFRRVALAKEMLIGMQSDISQIAFSCGFLSIQHFNRVFKRYVGYAPGKYKKLYFNSETFDLSHNKNQISDNKANDNKADK